MARRFDAAEGVYPAALLSSMCLPQSLVAFLLHQIACGYRVHILAGRVLGLPLDMMQAS